MKMTKMLLGFLIIISVLGRPTTKEPPSRAWILQVTDLSEQSNFSEFSIPAETPFLGLLSQVQIKDLFTTIGHNYDVLPLGNYLLETVTYCGKQVLVNVHSGDRYERLPPAEYQCVGNLDLPSLGYQWISLEDEVSIAKQTTQERTEEVDFSSHIVMDRENKYHLSWSPETDGIVFKLEVETLGFVGLGFSPSGGMKGADIVIAWVDDDDDEVHLTDRHAPGNFLPPLDSSQDLQLIKGYQNDTHTVVEFYRDWITCDENDAQLGQDTVRLLWSYHQEDKLQYHTHTQRGVRSVHLQEPSLSEAIVLEEDTKVWEVTAGNVTIPHDDHTHYFCRILQIPEDARKSKHQMVSVYPLIQPGNEAYVHHLTFSECVVPPALGPTEAHLQVHVDEPGIECYGPGMPSVWFFCRSIIAGWAVGSPGFVLPEHTGIPLGEQYGGATFYKLEMHYDNPAFHSEVIDNSGLRIAYTDKLREMDVGLLEVGKRVNILHSIPPHQNLFKTTGHCTSECTSQGLPEEGIHIFQGLLHTHLAGRKIRARHIRNGSELPIVAEDNNYDFNFQAARTFPNEVLVLPGDTLLTECVYETSDSFVHGGLSTREEMCLVHFFYYPKSTLSSCLSSVTFQTFLKSLGIDKVAGNSFEKFLDYTYHALPGRYKTDKRLLKEVIGNLSSEVELDTDVMIRLSDSKLYEDFTLQSELLWEILQKIQIEAPINLNGSTIGDLFKSSNWSAKGPSVSEINNKGEQVSQCTSPDLTPLIEYKPSKIPKFLELLTENVCNDF